MRDTLALAAMYIARHLAEAGLTDRADPNGHAIARDLARLCGLEARVAEVLDPLCVRPGRR